MKHCDRCGEKFRDPWEIMSLSIKAVHYKEPLTYKLCNLCFNDITDVISGRSRIVPMEEEEEE